MFDSVSQTGAGARRWSPCMGVLHYGDSLPVHRAPIGDEPVDLVYLDPPCNTDARSNAFFKGKHAAAASRIKALEAPRAMGVRRGGSLPRFSVRRRMN